MIRLRSPFILGSSWAILLICGLALAKGALAGEDPIYIDPNVPEPVAVQLRRDFKTLEAIQGDGGTPLHQRIFGSGVDGKAYLKWLKQRVHWINYDSSQCEGIPHPWADAHAIACHMSVFPGHEHTIWLTSVYAQEKRFLQRMLVLFHEARHTEREGDYWRHVDCRKDFVPSAFEARVEESGSLSCSKTREVMAAFSNGCDSTALGAYGLDVILADNLIRYCKNCGSEISGVLIHYFRADSYCRIQDVAAQEVLYEDMLQGRPNEYFPAY